MVVSGTFVEGEELPTEFWGDKESGIFHKFLPS